MGMAAQEYNWLWRQENQEFKAIVGHIDWVSKKLKEESQKEKPTN